MRFFCFAVKFSNENQIKIFPQYIYSFGGEPPPLSFQCASVGAMCIYGEKRKITANEILFITVGN